MINPIVPTSPELLIDAQDTAADATAQGILLLLGQCSQVTVVLQSDDTTSGGTIVIEEAYYTPTDKPYTGTWSQIGSTINASAFTGGAQQVIHIVGYSIWALRVRIATDITGGGSISCWAWGN